MAQKSSAQRNRFAVRFGFTGNKRAVFALVVVLLLVGLGVFLMYASSGGVELSRSDETSISNDSQEKQLEDSADAHTEKQDGDSTSEGESSSKEIHEVLQTTPEVVVDVDGAVHTPGVYVLSGTPRVNDAIIAAGGLLSEADTSALNLAAPLSDGEKIYVPRVGETVVSPTTTTTTSQTPSSSQTTSGQSANALVNINTATAEELDTLPGVGASTAQAIIEDREKNGPFTTPEDLMRVSGIGEKKFEKLEGKICV